MKLQQLYSKVRQAIEAYSMIEEGDKIALGISGGKDSLGLLYALAGIRSFYPKHFELVAITVDLGYKGFDLSQIKALCDKLQVEYQIIKTNISEAISEEGCSLCARLRKGALCDKAKALGCNKIAYAHNMDDVVETMMLSMIYEGRFSTFYPVTDLEDIGIKLIRPFVFVTQAEAVGFRNKYELPVAVNPCPFDHQSERTYVRELLSEINWHAPGVKKRMMTAICDGTLAEWKQKNG
ncbi:MAG: tRNA 2-thiocytidine biosynthesis TtcA family protein [Agathobacter sp.]|nr:tRNA 2-thiocytidine biosynthesis TtcA family protein [Agathobacter sp.]